MYGKKVLPTFYQSKLLSYKKYCSANVTGAGFHNMVTLNSQRYNGIMKRPGFHKSMETYLNWLIIFGLEITISL
jgi:hypothetical protein